MVIVKQEQKEALQKGMVTMEGIEMEVAEGTILLISLHCKLVSFGCWVKKKERITTTGLFSNQRTWTIQIFL